MTRTFIFTEPFRKCWAAMGLHDEELKLLEDILLENPQKGDVIEGTSGARKMRIQMNGHGKRGGGRVQLDSIKQCLGQRLLVLELGRTVAANINVRQLALLACKVHGVVVGDVNHQSSLGLARNQGNLLADGLLQLILLLVGQGLGSGNSNIRHGYILLSLGLGSTDCPWFILL